MSDAVRSAGFFTAHLPEADPEVHAAIQNELKRQRHNIELIASENITSLAVLEATGSVFTNKYAEGYPGKRYYGGCEYADVVETLAIERAKQLFGCQFANVQPNSGSQMNQAVFLALLQPGDTFVHPVVGFHVCSVHSIDDSAIDCSASECRLRACSSRPQALQRHARTPEPTSRS